MSNATKGTRWDEEIFAMPEWQRFEEMRTEIKKPLTPRARHMALNNLAGLKLDGYDPRDVLNQSVMHCWQGLFPVRRKAS